jgi:hypothetical protein
MNNPSPDLLGHPDQERVPLSPILWRSVQVLRRHPRLMTFPLLTTFACIGMFLALVGEFKLPLPLGWWNPASPSVWGSFHSEPLAVFYFSTMFLATFFNVALYHEVMRAFSGEKPSVAGGIRFALSRIGPIATWSLFAWSVGIIIRLVGERFGWIARITGVFAGFAWSVASVFAIPILVREGSLDPTAVLKDSWATVRRTWGGLVYGFVSLAPVTFICFLITGLAIGGIGSATKLSPTAIMMVETVVALCYLAGIAAMKDIYRCALYIYATEGVVPEPFLPADMDSGWKIKNSPLPAAPDGTKGVPSSRTGDGWRKVWKCITIIFAVVTGAFFVGLFALGLFFFNRVHSAEVYQGALLRVKTSPSATAVLGSPIKEGLLFSGSLSTDQAPSGTADFTFPISGPKGGAEVHVQASKNHGVWHYDHLVVLPDHAVASIEIPEPAANSQSAAR